MSRFRDLEKWYVENQQELSRQCRHASIGKTAEDSSEGWVYITLEAGSKTVQIRILNNGRMESAMWNERTLTEMDRVDREIGPAEDLGAVLSQYLQRLLGE